MKKKDETFPSLISGVGPTKPQDIPSNKRQQKIKTSYSSHASVFQRPKDLPSASPLGLDASQTPALLSQLLYSDICSSDSEDQASSYLSDTSEPQTDRRGAYSSPSYRSSSRAFYMQKRGGAVDSSPPSLSSSPELLSRSTKEDDSDSEIHRDKKDGQYFSHLRDNSLRAYHLQRPHGSWTDSSLSNLSSSPLSSSRSVSVESDSESRTRRSRASSIDSFSHEESDSELEDRSPVLMGQRPKLLFEPPEEDDIQDDKNSLKESIQFPIKRSLSEHNLDTQEFFVFETDTPVRHIPQDKQISKKSLKKNKKKKNKIFSALKINGKLLSVDEEIFILGGGISGCLCAKKFLEEGYKVVILEKNKELLTGTSGMTPGRMALGFHYADLETSIMCLDATLEFVKEYNQGFRIADDKNLFHPLRSGRYFIHKDSLVPPDELLAAYFKIKDAYAERVAEDPSIIQYFGRPEDFMRVLDRKEYQADVDASQIAYGLETREHLLNFPPFRKFVLEKLEKYKQSGALTVLTGKEVVKIDYAVLSALPFEIQTSDGSQYLAGNIGNMVWEHIEWLNNQLNYPIPDRINRLKVLAEVWLPASLRNKHSMFVALGPFCMFTNIGDGRGFLTYANITNVKNHNELKISNHDTLRRLRGGAEITETEKRLLGMEMIQGAAKIIPELKEAKLIGIKFGIVKTFGGDVEINDPKSDFHKRNYPGIFEEQLGYLSVNGVKLSYGVRNARLTLAIFKKHFQAIKILKELIIPQVGLGKNFQLFLLNILRRQLTTADILVDTQSKATKNPQTERNKQIVTLLKNKNKIVQEIKLFGQYDEFYKQKMAAVKEVDELFSRSFK